MDKWFEDKYEKGRIKRSAHKRLRYKKPNVFRKFSITTWFIFINIIFFVVVFALMLFFEPEQVLYWVALQPKAFFSGSVWQLVTSMFMHGNFTHLFVNMISLFFIGTFIERLIGRKRFFWLYILSGLAAGVFFVVLAFFFGGSELGMRLFGSPYVFAVGASGAIFALGGLLAILTPKLKVYVFFIVPMQMWIAMIFLLVVLWAVSLTSGLPIGNTAHLGGLLVGIFYALYLKKKYRRKTDMISKMFRG